MLTNRYLPPFGYDLGFNRIPGSFWNVVPDIVEQFDERDAKPVGYPLEADDGQPDFALFRSLDRLCIDPDSLGQRGLGHLPTEADLGDPLTERPQEPILSCVSCHGAHGTAVIRALESQFASC